MPKKLPQFWTTKDGRKLRFKDMELDHLINAFHMLRRLAARDYDDFTCAEQTGDLTLNKFVEHIRPEYRVLRDEIAKRLRQMPKNSIERRFYWLKFSGKLRATSVPVNQIAKAYQDKHDFPYEYPIEDERNF